MRYFAESMELHALTWQTVNGYPWAAFEGIPEFDPRTLRGQSVIIDGKPFTVRGVEVYAVVNPAGMRFGLLVTPLSVA